jgi:hypothetical protein
MRRLSYRRRPRSAIPATVRLVSATITRYQAGPMGLPVLAISQVDTYGAVLPNIVTVTLWAKSIPLRRVQKPGRIIPIWC